MVRSETDLSLCMTARKGFVKNMKITKGERVFYFINGLILIIFACICLYPVVYVASASVSSVEALMKGQVFLLPKGLNFGAYKKVFENSEIWVAYANTIYYTVFGTLAQLFITICGAYPLSKPYLRGKKLLNIFVVITMWFSGGMIPTYLNFVELGLVNTRAALIWGFTCMGMQVIIMRTFFQSIPHELEEAAKIDGAGHLRILLKIYFPLSVASFAILGLMFAVGRWNGYIWSMILFKDDNKMPLQVILKRIVVDTSFGAGNSSADNVTDKISEYSSDMIVYAVTETICSSKPEIMIACEPVPHSIVKERFLKLGYKHIEYVFDCLKTVENRVKNIKSYMLTMLYNSYSTIGHYYTAEVAADFKGGF